MPVYSLSFRLDFYPDWQGYKTFRDSVDAKLDKTHYSLSEMEFERKNRKEIYNSLGLKLYSHAWAETNLDDSVADRMLKLLEELESKRIGFLGSGFLTERLAQEEMGNAQWFVIFPPPESHDDFSLWDPYPECKAYRHPPYRHILESHFVSQKFKRCVEANHLTGIEFLWVNDKGRYKAAQWYCAIPTEAIGHGIDHEWFDREAYKNYLLGEKSSEDEITRKLRIRMNQEIIPLYAAGKWNFDNSFFKKGWSTGAESIDELLELFPKESLGLSVTTTPRFQMQYLPDTDFAYMWTDSDEQNDDGKWMRVRYLCFNRKAKDILLEANLLNEEDITGLKLYESVPAGCVDLDASAPVPPSVYTKEELAELRKIETRLYKQFLKKDKPERKPDLKRSLKLLRQAVRSRPDDFTKRKTKKKLQTFLTQFPFKFPGNWQTVLTIAGGGIFGDGDLDCEVIPMEDVGQYHQESAKERARNDEDYSGGFIYFATNASGDYFAFQKSETENLQGSPVVLISHEDCSIERKWEGVADFLESILLDH